MDPGFEPRLSRTRVFVQNHCIVLPRSSEEQKNQVSQVQSSAAADSEVRLGRQDFAFSAEEPELDPKGNESPSRVLIREVKWIDFTKFPATKPDSYKIVNTTPTISHILVHLSHFQKVKAPSKSTTNTLTLSSMALCISINLTSCHPAHPFSSLPSYILNPFSECFSHLLPCLVPEFAWKLCFHCCYLKVVGFFLSLTPCPCHTTRRWDGYVPCFPWPLPNHFIPFSFNPSSLEVYFIRLCPTSSGLPPSPVHPVSPFLLMTFSVFSFPSIAAILGYFRTPMAYPSNTLAACSSASSR